MALITEYGTPASNPGRPFLYGTDPDTGKEVFFLIRPLPLDIEESFRRRYIKKQRSRSTGLVERVFDSRHNLDFLKDRVCWMWVDSIDFEVRITDDKAAAFYRESTDLPDIQTGGSLKLDGHLADAVKRRIITNHPEIADFIVDRALDMRTETEQEEDDQGKD
jgi:hypothetical protein